MKAVGQQESQIRADFDSVGTQYGLVGEDEGRTLMLDPRGHNGTSFALPYSSLVAVGFDPSAGITLEFASHKVSVRGRNLRPVYDCLLAHRVTFIQEEDFDVMPESATCVDAIVVERLPEGEL
jgi:hypothetical protein